MNAPTTSTRPYLIRALYEWCTDNGFTPYVAVSVDETVQVPREYVKDNEIVLNIGFEATSSLTMGNEFIEFKARFGGSAREILVPISHVIAIYARENGQGMAFPLEPAATGVPVGGPVSPSAPEEGLAGSAAAPAPGASETAESKIMQLVESAPLADAGSAAAPQTDSPEPPKPPTRPRPSLKRVK
jgi:stringent starvation protein B